MPYDPGKMEQGLLKLGRDLEHRQWRAEHIGPTLPFAVALASLAIAIAALVIACIALT